MSEQETFLYLTTTGHKSGTSHHIEIWFVEHEGCYYIVAEHRERTHWVQNIQHQPQVTFCVGTRDHHDTARPATGRIIDPAAEPALAGAVAARMDAKYNWSNGLIVELVPEV